MNSEILKPKHHSAPSGMCHKQVFISILKLGGWPGQSSNKYIFEITTTDVYLHAKIVVRVPYK